MEKNEEIEQSAWNLSQHDIVLLGDLNRKCIFQYLGGDLLGCFHTSTQIRMLIHTDLNGQEDKNLDYLEKKVNFFLREMTLTKDKKLFLKYRHLMNQSIKKYRTYLRELEGKYGYLFSKKEDSSKMF